MFSLSPLSLSFPLFLPCLSLSLSFSPVSLSLPPLSLYLSYSLSRSCLYFYLSLSHPEALCLFLSSIFSLSPTPVVSLSFSHSCLPFYFSLTPVSPSPSLSLSLSLSPLSLSLFYPCLSSYLSLSHCLSFSVVLSLYRARLHYRATIRGCKSNLPCYNPVVL